MRPASFVTTVGSTGAGHDGRDVVIVNEPDVGATLRTRGRFYLLCEVDPPTRAGLEIAREVTELARHDYYYDLSAGVEVGLRRALRKANRRAAQLIREDRARTSLHLACAVVVNNEIAAARIGRAHVFLVRHARLFLPGEEPDELADFVHRTTTRQASSLGAETDLLPQVWRQTVEAGDTIILATGSITDGLGADALKNAAITLHPRAAADHVKNRAVAERIAGSSATIFIEIASGAGAAARRGGEPEVPATEPPEVVIAESIRSRVDVVWRRRPRPIAFLAVARPVTRVVAGAVGVVLELMPRRRPELPRRPESARLRSARTQRWTTLLAILLLLVTAAFGYGVVRNYQEDQIRNDYRIAIVDVDQSISAAESFAQRKDMDHAWEKADAASQRLAAAERSPAADRAQIAQLRARIDALQDTLNGVVVDLAKAVPGAKPAVLAETVNGIYVADPGAGRLWRLSGKPLVTGVVLERGKAGVGGPGFVTAQDAALLTLDDARRLWRAEGNTVKQIPLPGTEKWKAASGLATFAGNVYVLDAQSGQVWRYEPDFAGALAGPTGFLPAALPAGSARELAVDGDIWVLTSSGEIQRYRRQGIDPVLTRLTFTVQWKGTPLAPTNFQALESQGSLWILDANARVVAQITRDGREIARWSLSQHLPAPTAFFVSEKQDVAYTVHGSKIATTDLSR
ncbi:MAG: hypothetical protein KGN00_10815 [Chloroflexota bacterium]|nr:hypothetical protein [Chloroflexota bacterium]MDE3194169.1 hypothetical protein [Chloroflexota bacterium]